MKQQTPERSLQLLTTKIWLPPVRDGLIGRPQLLTLIAQAGQYPLTLVSAPAGFGKTALISSWLQATGISSAWYSLDDGDNDTALFLTYLIAALKSISDVIGQGALAALTVPRKAAVESIIIPLINDLTKFGRDLVLVLDDYHMIDNQEIHRALEFLLDHAPPNLHLVLSTRVDPPLPLARYRGRRQLLELRTAALRFSDNEVDALFRKATGNRLPIEDIALITQTTEGWITGLQMVIMAIEGRSDISGYLRTFIRSNRYILDYLFEEVFRQQPEEIRLFLLRTAVLESLTPPLCDFLLEADGSAVILRQLERSNLFIIPLDNQQTWYRYHHLFSSLLQQRLLQEQPDSVPALHLRASEWFQRNGLPQVAIRHALAAGSYDRAAELIENEVEAAICRSEVSTVMHWIDPIPTEYLRDYPRLLVFHAMARLMGGKPLEDVEQRLREVETLPLADKVEGELTLVKALIAAYQQRIHDSIRLSERALELLPDESIFLKSVIAGNLGLAHLYTGNWAVATRALEQAVEIGLQAGNKMNTVLAMVHLAELAMLRMELLESERIYRQAIELVTDEQGQMLPVAGFGLLGLGFLCLEWNQLRQAESYFRQGVELVRGWGEIGTLQGYIGLAQVAQFHHDYRSAAVYLDEADRIARQFDAMVIDDISVGLRKAQLALAEGELAAVEKWAAERELGPEIEPELLQGVRTGSTWATFLRQAEYITLARLYRYRGRPDLALMVLESLETAARTGNNHWTLAEILVQKALAGHSLKNYSLAVDQFIAALKVAAPAGVIRIFLVEAALAADLLQLARRQLAIGSDGRPKIDGVYLDKLSAALTEQVSVGPDTDLSLREMEVLRQAARGLSNRQIADSLFISLNTVKTHMKNIHGKLGVGKRIQAIERAKELGLLKKDIAS
ncbi:MAG: LuxR C-terminal-related transcriptional regulator [Candidatus Neomarinimicrobiota bacterium]